MKKDSKALTCMKDICRFLDITKYTFYKFVQLGLPVRKEGRDWVGHKDEINDWFRIQKYFEK